MFEKMIFNKTVKYIERYGKLSAMNSLDPKVKILQSQLENKIIENIEKNPDILVIRSKEMPCKTIGMIACENNMPKVALKVLETNSQAACIRDWLLRNMGMYAAENNMEEVVLAVLDNRLAALQRDEFGWDLGIYAYKNKMQKAVDKVFADPKLSRRLVEKMNKKEEMKRNIIAANKKENTEVGISDIYDEVFGK